MSWPRPCPGLDQPVSDDGETALGDLLATERPEPSEEVGAADRDRRVNEIVEELPEAERNVLRLRFGLAGDEPRTLKQTGSELGISAERARELEERGPRRFPAARASSASSRSRANRPPTPAAAGHSDVVARRRFCFSRRRLPP